MPQKTGLWNKCSISTKQGCSLENKLQHSAFHNKVTYAASCMENGQILFFNSIMMHNFKNRIIWVTWGHLQPTLLRAGACNLLAWVRWAPSLLHGRWWGQQGLGWPGA